MDMVFCRGCASEIHSTAASCPSCGATQSDAYALPVKTQTIAGLWCFFLGSFGAHRFYLGKTLSAVFYLLFCWTGIPGLIAIFEMLFIAFQNHDIWDRNNNNGQPSPPVHFLIKLMALLLPILFFGGILASVAIPQYANYVERAEQSQNR